MQIVLIAFEILAIVQLSLSCSVATSSSCNSDLFQCCGKQLRADLGLSQCYGILAFDPDCHRQEIENMYSNGTNGLLFVCDAFNKYYECLGSARADCLSVKYHAKAGLRLSDALNVVSTFRQFGFACGAGFEGFSNNDVCMSQIFTHSKKQLQACRDLFTSRVGANNPNNCQYFKEYVGCYTMLFEHSSCNMESSYWGCEYARQSGKIIIHDCDLQCYSQKAN